MIYNQEGALVILFLVKSTKLNCQHEDSLMFA